MKIDPQQVLRGALAIAFPYAMHAVPHEVRYVAPLVAGGVLGYVLARVGMLLEPHTLRRYAFVSRRAQMGEAIIVSLALAMALVLVHEQGLLPFGISGGVIAVIAYLIFHAAVLPLLFAWRAGRVGNAPPREALRRFIQIAAFVAEATVVAMLMTVAVDAHQEMRQGPWGFVDALTLPWLPILLLVFCYPPIAALEVAASRRGETLGDAAHEVFEAALIIFAAIYVVAFTGAEPWI